ncbi:hypothetical protein CWC03_23140 [Pseudoalteromonas sp. S2755]|nr:hypothetical protein CWC03_23140 [Pseudoalteromonas sp. S2755]
MKSKITALFSGLLMSVLISASAVALESNTVENDYSYCEIQFNICLLNQSRSHCWQFYQRCLNQ